MYEKQLEKENSELVGCTFHPNILYSPKSENKTYRDNSYTGKDLLILNNSSNSLLNNNPRFDINNGQINLNENSRQ